MDNKTSLLDKIFSKPGYKFYLFLVSYVIANVIIAMVFGLFEEGDLGMFIAMLQLFPIGLLWFFTHGKVPWLGELWLVITWVIYITIALAAIANENSRTSKKLYVIFVILLILNIYGCTQSGF